MESKETELSSEYEGLVGFVLGIMEDMGEVGVGIAVFLETFIPPIPSEAILPSAGFLSYEGKLNVWGAWGFATLGALLGAIVWYIIGSLLGRERARDIVGKTPLLKYNDFDRAEEFFRKWGTLAVFAGRCIPIVRSFVSIPAGIEKMNFTAFSIYTLAGSGIWNGLWVGLGFWFGPAIKPALQDWSGIISNVALFVILGLVILFAAKRLYDIFKERRIL